jgi:outer membrane protein assembly factor BamB
MKLAPHFFASHCFNLLPMPIKFSMMAAAAAVATAASGWAGTTSADLSMFRNNPAHTGVYAGRAILSEPKLKWKYRTSGEIIASPTVDRGTVFVGSTDGFLYAIDAQSGSLRWKYKASARIVSSAAVWNGTVYVGSYDRNFYAIDAATGALKWKFKTPAERRFAAEHIHGTYPYSETMPDPFDFYMSSPAISNGLAYFGSGDGNVYALNANTGAPIWTFKTGDVVHASPAVVDGVLYVGSWDSYFYALDAATGTVKWKFKTGEDPDIHNQVGIQSSAAVVDGVVYFGCRDSKLYAVDARTGKMVWVVDNKGSWVNSSPAVSNGVVYATTADTGQFFATDAKTGAALFSVDFKHWPMFSSPAIVGEVAYQGSHTGRLLAINLATHKLQWAFKTDGSEANLARYTSADGTPNYAASQTENFYDALVVGVDRLMSVGAVLSSASVADSVVYFGSMDGNLYALAAPN